MYLFCVWETCVYFIYFLYFIFTTSVKARYYHFCFTCEKRDIQRNQVLSVISGISGSQIKVHLHSKTSILKFQAKQFQA